MDFSSEHDILLGCQNRNPKAQAALYNLYKRRLLGVCRRYCRTVAEAEDVFQEAFVKVFLKIESLKSADALGAWIKAVVINTATDHYRKSLKNNLSVEYTGQENEEIEQEIEFELENRDQLLQIISAMPPGYRLAVNMYYIDGYKHQQIADLLGISLSTSKSQLFHAKAWLKERIEAQKLKDTIINSYKL
jgi:RNA polymerase sigma factor (sigma-70 family)